MISRIEAFYRKAKLARARARQIELVQQVEASDRTPKPYVTKPDISAIVQHFNKRPNIRTIFSALEASDIPEIIYLDDGSIDGSFDELMELSIGKNHFLIRSNDLFEVRTYDRAIDFARSDIVVLLQDDDIPPADPAWIRTALEHFQRDPLLAILGGRDGLTLRTSPDSQTGLAYDVTRLISDGEFCYVDAVNRAPMFVRKSALKALGGIDQTFAPFQCDDVDLCLRAWIKGFHVALMPCGFVRDVGVGGMRLFNDEKVTPQARKNWRIIYERYSKLIDSGLFREATEAAMRQISR